MKNLFIKGILLLLGALLVEPAAAQFNLKKALGGAAKVAQAATLTDRKSVV